MQHRYHPKGRIHQNGLGYPLTLPTVGAILHPFEPGTVQPMAGADLHRAPFTEQAILTDGGIYDNLGLERVWKRCRTILVSNAGRNTPEIGSPTGRWCGQLFRTLFLEQQQAENSRKQILFGMNNLGQRKVAFWSIDTPIVSYGLVDALALPPEITMTAGNMRTRLNPFSEAEISLLLKAGYAGADASLRTRKLAVNLSTADFGRLPEII